MISQTKTKQRRTNRSQILLDAAARRFLRDGYAAASMRDIAADAGMRASSIYHHFPSKADLLVAVHEEGLRRITGAVTVAVARQSEPWQRLEAACVAHLTVLLEGGDFFRAVMQEMPRGESQLYQQVTKMRDEHESIFARLIDGLQLPRGVDRRHLRLLLLGAMNWSHSWYRPGGQTPAQIARKFVKYLRIELDVKT